MNDVALLFGGGLCPNPRSSHRIPAPPATSGAGFYCWATRPPHFSPSYNHARLPPYYPGYYHTRSWLSQSAACPCYEDPQLTAVCVSIDRILQNTAPICCLSFDGIGVRHPGMTHGVGARSLCVAHSHYRATRKNQGHIPRVSRDSLTTLQTGKRTGKSDSRPARGQRAGKLMPGCRDAGLQYDQKVNNELGPYPVGYGLSKRK